MNPNQTMALFASHASTFQNVEASTAKVWPNDGDHACWLNGIDILTDTQFYMGQEKIPGVSVAFNYTLVEDPDRETPLTFTGDPCVMPIDPSQIIGDNYKKKYEIGLGRLKGSLSVLLGGNSSGDLGQDIVSAQNLLQRHSDTGLCVKTRINSRPGKPDANGNVRVFRSDAIIELVSAPVAS